jgi:hypothetical protein
MHVPFQSSSGFFPYASLSPTRVYIGLRVEPVKWLPGLDRHTIGFLVVNEDGLRSKLITMPRLSLKPRTPNASQYQLHTQSFSASSPATTLTSISFTTRHPIHTTQDSSTCTSHLKAPFSLPPPEPQISPKLLACATRSLVRSCHASTFQPLTNTISVLQVTPAHSSPIEETALTLSSPALSTPRAATTELVWSISMIAFYFSVDSTPPLFPRRSVNFSRRLATQSATRISSRTIPHSTPA